MGIMGWTSPEQNWKKILGSLEMPYEELKGKKKMLFKVLSNYTNPN
jgi:hypothetical protein